MKKISYAELKNTLYKFNEENNITVKGTGKYITGVIVFKSSNWPEKNYSLGSRSYSVSSDNKAFIPGQLGYSIFGSALDGTDPYVRLEQYMKDEYAREKGWEVDYCYMEGEDD